MTLHAEALDTLRGWHAPSPGQEALRARYVDPPHYTIRYSDPSDEETSTLMEYLDGQKKRNLVLTFGGGVQEVQRELIAMFGLGLPKVPR